MDQAKKTFNYSTKRYSLSLTSVAAQLSDNACDSQKKERWEQRQRLRQFRTGLGQFSIPSWGEEDHSEGGHEHAGQHRQESGQGGGSLLLSQRFSRDAQHQPKDQGENLVSPRLSQWLKLTLAILCLCLVYKYFHQDRIILQHHSILIILV